MANHVLFDNYVLEQRVEDMLLTRLDMNQFLTPDYSLTENPGMIKKVHTYVAQGSPEELEMGQGNSDSYTVSFTEKEYKVGVTQSHLMYYDEQYMTDPMVVSVGIDGLAAGMTNDLTTKAITAMGETTLTYPVSNWDFNAFADAVALYPYEDEEGLFCIINPAQKAEIRKALKDDLKYVEDFSRAGYIGSVCGVNLFVSKAVPEGEAYLGTRKAVTCFVKKGVEVEQERDADHRKNDIFSRKVMLVALTDGTRMIKMKKN